MGEVPKEGKKVLIVDDEIDMRIFLSTLFKVNGYTPVAVRDGKAGIEKVREQDFDLIMLDVMMPGEGGAVMYRHLKSDAELMDIPVIVLSGVEEKSFLHYLRMSNLGKEKALPDPDYYMEKPPDPDQLIEKAKTLLKDTGDGV